MQKVLFSETPLPPPVLRGDIRPHILESPLTQEGQVIPLQISSQVGRRRRFLGESLWQQWPIGWEGYALVSVGLASVSLSLR